MITFGNELQMQSLSSDERIRQRKTTSSTHRDEASSTSSPTGAPSTALATEAPTDFRAILTEASLPQGRARASRFCCERKYGPRRGASESCIESIHLHRLLGAWYPTQA